jgi:AraC-like DNA-binding protein
MQMSLSSLLPLPLFFKMIMSKPNGFYAVNGHKFDKIGHSSIIVSIKKEHQSLIRDEIIVKELFVSNVDQIGFRRMVYGLGPLVTYLENIACDTMECFSKANISPGSISDPSATMSLAQELAFTQAAIEYAEDQSLGLAVGPSYHLSTYGMLGLSMMSAETLYQGLTVMSGMHALCWTHLRWRQLVDGNDAILEGCEVESLSPCASYMIERDFSAAVVMLNEMLGENLPLKGVFFTRKEPGHLKKYLDFFKCPVTFNANSNALVFDAVWLNKSLPQANETVFKVCYAQCKALVERHSGEDSYAKLVERLIVDGTGNFFSFEQVAEKLHITPRTLRRKLDKENTSFRELSINVRSTLAKELLRDGKLSVDQVAERLGYSDSASFCHAFKSWTKQSPSAFR